MVKPSFRKWILVFYYYTRIKFQHITQANPFNVLFYKYITKRLKGKLFWGSKIQFHSDENNFLTQEG
jgi:hypothetical protein